MSINTYTYTYSYTHTCRAGNLPADPIGEKKHPAGELPADLIRDNLQGQRRSGRDRGADYDSQRERYSMIINKLASLWTEEQRRAFEELNAQARTIWESMPEDERLTPESFAKIEETLDARQAIIDQVADRYVKSFARRKSAVFADIREIVGAITKEDYQDTIKSTAVILSSLEGGDAVDFILNHPEEIPTESYEGCFDFIASHLSEQYKVIARYGLSESRANSIIAEQVSKWYENKTPDLLLLAHGRATDILPTISERDAVYDPIADRATLEKENVQVFIENFENSTSKLQVRSNKLLTYGVAQFSRVNNRNTHSNTIRPAITFPLEDYARLIGLNVDPDPEADPIAEKKRIRNLLNDAQKKVKSDLELLHNVKISWSEQIKGKAQDFDQVSILSRVACKKGIIYMEFGYSMGQYLKAIPQSRYPTTQYLIDARKPNAYALGNKLAYHYYMDSNQKRGTANRLKVETLLKCCPEIRSYDEVLANGHSWTERIKTPFESELQEVPRVGTLKEGHYTRARGIELTAEDALNITDYNTFKDLYVTFVMGVEVDNTERFNRQEDRRTKTNTTAKNSHRK